MIQPYGNIEQPLDRCQPEREIDYGGECACHRTHLVGACKHHVTQFRGPAVEVDASLLDKIRDAYS